MFKYFNQVSFLRVHFTIKQDNFFDYLFVIKFIQYQNDHKLTIAVFFSFLAQINFP